LNASGRRTASPSDVSREKKKKEVDAGTFLHYLGERGKRRERERVDDQILAEYYLLSKSHYRKKPVGKERKGQAFSGQILRLAREHSEKKKRRGRRGDSLFISAWREKRKRISHQEGGGKKGEEERGKSQMISSLLLRNATRGEEKGRKKGESPSILFLNNCQRRGREGGEKKKPSSSSLLSFFVPCAQRGGERDVDNLSSSIARGKKRSAIKFPNIISTFSQQHRNSFHRGGEKEEEGEKERAIPERLII